MSDELEQVLTANPELIPAQFEGNVNKALEAYKSLQAEYTKNQQALREAEAKLTQVPDPNPQPPPPPPTSPPAVPAPVGLAVPPPEEATPQVVDWDAMATEFRTKGSLSNDTVEQMKKLGVSQSNITAFVNGQKALLAQERAAASAVVGGEENLQALLTWVSKNKTEEERQSINEGLAGPHATHILTGLNVEFGQATREGGTIPQTSTKAGGTAPSTTLKFHEQADVMRAMNDPRYFTDTAYRQEVEVATAQFYAGNTQINVRRT